MPKLVLTPEIEDAILAQVSEGIPLAEACRRHDVGRTTIYDKRDADPEFAERLARARELGEDALAEETLEIADDGTNDWIERRNADGSTYEALNGEHVQRSKLRIETRLKLLAVWNPKKYGAAQTIKHADADGEKLDLDPVARATRLAAIAAEALRQNGESEPD